MMVSCGNEKNAPTEADSATSTEIVTETPTTPQLQTTPPPTSEPAQNADGVWHYTCPKGCEGGAGSMVPCPKCGTSLAHNSAYHAAAPPTNPAVGGNVDLQQAAPPVQEPAQNDKGVWHYTCPKGCAGGAGSASTCNTCGATLVHNKGYH